jgi:type IV pilus assembly protein PilC
LLTLLAVSAVMVHLYQTEAGQRFFDGLKLKVPGLGPLIHRSSLSRMIHALSALSKAHVPLACALPLAGKAAGNLLLRDALAQAAHRVQCGGGANNGGAPGTLGAAMKASEQLPPQMTQMIAAGEDAGHLIQTLDQIALSLDAEVDRSVRRLLNLVSPIVYTGFLLVVALTLLGLYYPIFNLGNVIK